MQVKCQVIADSANEYVGKKGLVKDQRLSLLDVDEQTDGRLTNTFDYDLRPEEKEKHAGKLLGKIIKLAVNDFVVFGGRLRARGRILAADVKPA